MLDLKHVELKYTKAELLYGLVTVVVWMYLVMGVRKIKFVGR